MLEHKVRLLSPAKINLFLKILSKRKDDFHNIHTLFERVGLYDELTFAHAPSGIRIQTQSKQIPKGRKNIVYQAAQLLKKTYSVKEGVRITIKKRIPVSAGLGGGSGNAATTLIALSRLWKLSLGRDELLRLGSRLGSDVSFFLMNTSFALGEGRGEILTKIKGPARPLWHCLVKPNFGLSTKAAYRSGKFTFLTPHKADVRMLFHSIQKVDSAVLQKCLVNSLEQSLCRGTARRALTIFDIKKRLLELGALGALMSGSGSGVFGIYKTENSAKKAASILRKNKNWQVFVVHTI